MGSDPKVMEHSSKVETRQKTRLFSWSYFYKSASIVFPNLNIPFLKFQQNPCFLSALTVL